MNLSEILKGFHDAGTKTIAGDGKVYTFTPGAGGGLSAPMAPQDNNLVKASSGVKAKVITKPVQTAAARD